MCKWRDSVAAVDAAADRLAQVCEATIRDRPMPRAANERGEHRGTVRAMRTAIRDLSTTPLMAARLKRIK